MSAVMKEEVKDLATVLILDDQLPDDFYSNPVYEKRLDKAIEETKNLVYTLDEVGEKAAKADATAINKFATLFDKFIAATFKKQTEAVSLWRDGKKAKTKLLLENRQRLLDQFSERRQAKLDQIRVMLTDLLDLCRQESGVSQAFFTNPDLTPMVKLTGAMTDGGKLTKSSADFIKNIVSAELSEQTRITARHLILENRCLKEGINPPLTQFHFGTVFYAEDSFFNEKLEELIKVEIERRAEMEARIRKQQEEENERRIQAALREQQEEANRKAIAEARKIQEEQERAQDETKKPDEPVKQTPDQLRARANSLAQSAEMADRTDDYKREMQQAHSLRKRADDLEREQQDAAQKKQTAEANGRKILTIAAVFEISIRDTVSNEAFLEHFIAQMPEKMQAALKSIEVSNA